MGSPLFRRVLSLAAVLALGLGLVRPALGVSWNCGLQEHVHTDNCYRNFRDGPRVLTCRLPVHNHQRECFQKAAEPTPETTGATVPVTEETVLLEDITQEVMAEQTVSHTADAREDDLSTVTGDGIRFRLFNYSLDINKASQKTAWRTISEYFTFRSASLPKGESPSEEIHIPSWNCNQSYDADGFTANHATVEWKLQNGLPVLSLTRNPDPDGGDRTDPGLSAADRSLAYLFSGGDHAVTAYSPANTILQRSGNRYLYNSRDHAVDYDISANRFRLRSYAERNSTTAGYGSGYGDFLPFTYTGGETVGTVEGTDYQVASADVDYWFGMTMDLRFFQTKGGQTEGEDMIFRFSGDDDVWVFVDDVLVLDLGGTHGTATGSINFATGEVVQYLSWNGGTPESTATSFPTTIRACFDSAGATPNGGWNESGTAFADYTEHTLKFFYLERGAAVANCLLDFRLPTLPEKSLTVTKDLVSTGAGEVESFIEDSLSYQFRVVKADENGQPTGELFLKPGTAYTLLSGGSASGSGVIGQDGCFFLKAGQSAQFTDMLTKGGGAVNYIVQEILPTNLTGQYAGVEYQVSGAEGSIETENGLEEAFTSFSTGALTAEQTQTVTYRNQVDISRLGRLQITKGAAPGSEFPQGQVFRVQVTLGGIPLPAGTAYDVGMERKTVTEPGILELEIGQTAVLSQGILSGTSYEVTELADGVSRPSYSGTATNGGTAEVFDGGIRGEFGLGSTVSLTVTNASYDFPAQIPLYKQALDFTGTETFFFSAQLVESGTWAPIRTIPGTAITVTGSAVHPGSLTIGFSGRTEGVFHYRIEEIPGDGDFLYDDSFYIAELTVADGSASVTRILKNGTEETDRILFQNRRTTTLTVTKEVTGALYNGSFPFTAAVTLGGSPVTLSQSEAGEAYRVSGNTISFSLSHGQSITIPGIPCHATVTVTETDFDGFTPWLRVEGLDDENIPGNAVTVTFAAQPETVHFVNNGGYQLPATGGPGLLPGYLAGLGLTTASAWLYCRNRRRKEGRR